MQGENEFDGEIVKYAKIYDRFFFITWLKPFWKENTNYKSIFQKNS